jgi:Shedu protein SduA, C-terminal
MPTGVPKPNRYKFEFQIQGAFRADLVVGSLPQASFVLVEFEGAEANSIFGRGGTVQMKDWSRQIEHGFSQLVDWAWVMDDETQLLRNAFGCGEIRTISLVVCGRDHFMDETERKRFQWRRENIRISATNAKCLTYDDLLVFFESQIEAIKSYLNATS